ncbi:MAG: DUF342 domain-containing protein [Desulfovibrionaceae bacterium]|jgi:uncharacterized protein (DUF342 family)|nr:DUF342 domain-containing protein [Desulfovibrionaceae bacterium]
MPYFLRHHFEPDLTPRVLRPKESTSGSVDHHDLGYVQNVVVEQVLAEFVKVTDEAANALPARFVYAKPEFPAGRNTGVNPSIPTQLLAEANGHVAYENGLIVVKKALRINGHVDYHTGNIFFVGDLMVDGGLHTGFEVQARNTLVKGIVEGARVVAEASIVCEAGVKGAKQARLFAGKSIRLPFCENASLLARESVLVDGTCMHSDLRVGGKLVVKGRLQGGTARCNGVIFVGEQLGGGTSTVTEVVLGIDPFLDMHLAEVEESIEAASEHLAEYTAHWEKGGELAEEFGPRKEQAERKLKALERRRTQLGEALARSGALDAARLVVPGQVRSGVNITIGPAKTTVREHLENVHFRLEDGEIVTESPAMKR